MQCLCPLHLLLRPCRSLLSFVSQYNASADQLVEKLRGKADGKTEVVMLEELNRTTLAVIAKVGLDDEERRLNVEALGIVLSGSSQALLHALRHSTFTLLASVSFNSFSF